MQMWRLGSDTHVQTVHEHSPMWHMCISSSWHWLVCIEAHWENPIQFSWIQFNPVQSSKCWLSTYYMLWITWHWEYWIFFLKMKSQVTVQGRRQPCDQMQLVSVLRAVEDVQSHIYTHSHPGGCRHMFSNTYTHTVSVLIQTHICEGIHPDTTHTGSCVQAYHTHVHARMMGTHEHQHSHLLTLTIACWCLNGLCLLQKPVVTSCAVWLAVLWVLW